MVEGGRGRGSDKGGGRERSGGVIRVVEGRSGRGSDQGGWQGEGGGRVE